LYVSESVTIADLSLVAATICLEAIKYDFSKYTAVTAWYENFKKACPELWEIALSGMKEIEGFENNPPPLPDLDHPLYEVRK
jgi:glutathione S-transferase